MLGWARRLRSAASRRKRSTSPSGVPFPIFPPSSAIFLRRAAPVATDDKAADGGNVEVLVEEPAEVIFLLLVADRGVAQLGGGFFLQIVEKAGGLLGIEGRCRIRQHEIRKCHKADDEEGSRKIAPHEVTPAKTCFGREFLRSLAARWTGRHC